MKIIRLKASSRIHFDDNKFMDTTEPMSATLLKHNGKRTLIIQSLGIYNGFIPAIMVLILAGSLLRTFYSSFKQKG